MRLRQERRLQRQLQWSREAADLGAQALMRP